MDKFQQVLTQYWGYTKFRPLQSEIIHSVINGNDTLGLMPTGGGKSITFQVPTLIMKGTCIVITPLIALMNDQVINLKEKGIKAEAIHSGYSFHENEMAISRCKYGDVKFLYVSPERLLSQNFKNHLEQMTICLLAVDEAHCISQWGYDFRPSYLQISKLREQIEGVPLLALTATATPKVVEDIQEKLSFPKKNVFQKSFERKNLFYIVRHTEDKYKYLLRIFKKISGSSIVYVRSRKATKEIADFLRKNGKTADFFHAGLSEALKKGKYEAWKSNRMQIIVATNAFGMGIDKPDVRAVVHYDLPESLEAYFQEAGRAGRDEKRAYAVLLYNKSDDLKFQKIILSSFPKKKLIAKIYSSVANYLELEISEGKNISFPFDITTFCTKFKHHPLQVYHSLKILKRAEFVDFTEELDNPSRLTFIVKRDDLYKFQIANKKFDAFIKLILRMYTGIFSTYTKIDEEFIAQKANTKPEVVYEYLKKLSKMKIIRYIPRKKSPFVEFINGRLPDDFIVLRKEVYQDRLAMLKNKIDNIIRYASDSYRCRSRILLEYFGESNAYPCGNCDVCRKKNELGLTNLEFDHIYTKINQQLITKLLTLEELVERIDCNEKKLIKVVRWLLDNKKISKTKELKLKWN